MSWRTGYRTLWAVARRLRSKQQIRQLSLHEYQSQGLLKEYGIPVASGELAVSPGEVKTIVQQLGGPCIIKSQILRGGRGKGIFDSGLPGGIQKINSPSVGETVAARMLGHRLKTKQTPGDGLKVDKAYVAQAVQYEDEWYLAMTIDRENYRPAIIISKSGGVDIETLAKASPEELLTFHFNLTEGITTGLIDEIAKALGTPEIETRNLSDIFSRMHRLFADKDATMLEINPLVRSPDGSFTCLDAKFSFDNAAEVRQRDLFAMHDPGEAVSGETEAKKYGLVYVRLDGDIGNVVNGAGLAMATNDAIAYHGGSSANFLDAGGQATKETMQKAFKIILQDSRVKTILINIYGGIIRCDMIAESIVAAYTELGPLSVPVVVRLQGTNSEEGLQLLADADLGLYTEADFGEAAKRAVELAR